MGVSFVPVSRVEALPRGTMKPIELGGRELMLAHSEAGYFAFARECPHESADLQTGELAGSQIRCANHGYCFELMTGDCLVPEGGPKLTTLPVEVRGDEICIRLEW